MSKHTKGPWKHKPVHGEANRGLILDANGSGNWIAEIRTNGEFFDQKQKEILDLFASAPELLLALKYAVKWVRKGIECGAYKDCAGVGALEYNYNQMLILIKKAEGQSCSVLDEEMSGENYAIDKWMK